MSLVGVIACGTKNVSFLVYKLPDSKPLVAHSLGIPMITPQNGWYENDARQIISLIQGTMKKGLSLLSSQTNYDAKDIRCVAITNQRETIVAWDSRTGRPLYNAISWKDIRTHDMMARLEEKRERIRQLSGLQLAEIFPALKIRWMLENVRSVKEAIEDNYLRLGTVDSWVLWSLTNGDSFCTDVTNASHTLLMNIETLNWDAELLEIFQIRAEWLPKICSSSEIYGRISHERMPLHNVQISGMIGNQQSALLGHYCLSPGMAKCTYRSGCFLLCNIGHRMIHSKSGLLTTVAFKLGPKQPAVYALEGSVLVAGHVFTWLMRRLGILDTFESAAEVAAGVPNSCDVYFVPAFTGLAAPHWRSSSRGLIIGLTQFSTSQHIVRAAFDSIAYQVRDIIEAIRQDIGFDLKSMVTDGPMSKVKILMQIQADILGATINHSDLEYAEGLGAAMCAGHAEGVDLFRIDHTHEIKPIFSHTFDPKVAKRAREVAYDKWKQAVNRSFDWVTPPPHAADKAQPTGGATERASKVKSKKRNCEVS